MALSVGQIYHNRYRIVSLMGKGGFGAVYKAWDTKLNGPCALKENFDTSAEAEKQFALEASMLFNLRHPNLPMVFDYFSVPGQGLYLVMVYVEGEDLQQLLDKRQEPLPEALVLPWIRQVCDALSYLHKQQPPVIHRDIKPANIKITPQGQAVLVDFGIAKVYDPKLKTTVGARAVTPGYSPPEQYGRGSTDPRTDIYALGATLYTMLTGVEPPDSVDLLSGIGAPLAGVRTLNPKVTSTVDAAIQRAMQLDRGQRFQTVDDFETALLAVSPTVRAQTQPSPAEIFQTRVPDEAESVKTIKTGKKRWFKPWYLILLPVLFCIVVSALMVLLEPTRDWLFEVYDNLMAEVEPESYSPEEDEPAPPEEAAAEAAAKAVAEPQGDIQRYEVPLDMDPKIGPPEAPVTIIEFGDFGSEACREWYYEIFPRLRETFWEEIQLFFVDYPQEWLHADAFSAALAANCAMEQERYWEYHEALFSRDLGLGVPSYFGYAANLGMNLDEFRFCFETEIYHEEIMEDIRIGEELGIEHTPTFFINGIRVDGVVPFEEFVEMIEGELEGR